MKLAKALGCAVFVVVVGLVAVIGLLRWVWVSGEVTLPPVSSPNGVYVAHVKARPFQGLGGELTITRAGRSEPVAVRAFNGREEALRLGGVTWSPDSNRVAIVILNGSAANDTSADAVDTVYVYDVATGDDGSGNPSMTWNAGKQISTPDKVYCRWQTPGKMLLVAQRGGKDVLPPVTLVVTNGGGHLVVGTAKTH